MIEVLSMMMMPMPVPDPSSLPRLRQLETALACTLDILQAVMERLEKKLGPGFAGSDLARIAAGGTLADWQHEVAEIDRYIAEGRPSTAVRHFHDQFGFRWDEAQVAVQRWSYYLPAEKLQSIRLARFVKALDHHPV